jgi:hypothetical protein
MAQYCSYCKWYSADGLTHCTTCGAPFADDLEEEPEAEEEAEERPLLERIGWTLALVAGLAVGSTALYGRLATPRNAQAAGAAVSNAADAVKGAIGAFYTLLVGPNEEYKPYVIIALAVSAFVWLVLFILGRLGRSGL